MENGCKKVLFLHGYGQNESIFKEKTGFFRKLFKNIIQCYYMTAPNKIPVTEAHMESDEENMCSQQFAWWINKNYALQHNEWILDYESYQLSFLAVEKYFQQNGPFVGILGFSQGAAFLANLCHLQQQKKLNFQFTFAIMVSGFKQEGILEDFNYQNMIYIPSLHIYGEKDLIIPKEMSIGLQNYFCEPKTILHEGGHYLPCTPSIKKAYVNFVMSMIT